MREFEGCRGDVAVFDLGAPIGGKPVLKTRANRGADPLVGALASESPWRAVADAHRDATIDAQDTHRTNSAHIRNVNIDPNSGIDPRSITEASGSGFMIAEPDANAYEARCL